MISKALNSAHTKISWHQSRSWVGFGFFFQSFMPSLNDFYFFNWNGPFSTFEGSQAALSFTSSLCWANHWALQSGENEFQVRSVEGTLGAVSEKFFHSQSLDTPILLRFSSGKLCDGVCKARLCLQRCQCLAAEELQGSMMPPYIPQLSCTPSGNTWSQCFVLPSCWQALLT